MPKKKSSFVKLFQRTAGSPAETKFSNEINEVGSLVFSLDQLTTFMKTHKDNIEKINESEAKLKSGKLSEDDAQLNKNFAEHLMTENKSISNFINHYQKDVFDKLQSANISSKFDSYLKDLKQEDKIKKLDNKIEKGLTGKKKVAAYLLAIVTFGKKSVKKQQEKYALKNINKEGASVSNSLVIMEKLKAITEIASEGNNPLSNAVKEANFTNKFVEMGKELKSDINNFKIKQAGLLNAKSEIEELATYKKQGLKAVKPAKTKEVKKKVRFNLPERTKGSRKSSFSLGK